jgi:hypothetical protein
MCNQLFFLIHSGTFRTSLHWGCNSTGMHLFITIHVYIKNIKTVYNLLHKTMLFFPLQINGINVRKCRHEEVVSLLFPSV